MKFYGHSSAGPVPDIAHLIYLHSNKFPSRQPAFSPFALSAPWNSQGPVSQRVYELIIQSLKYNFSFYMHNNDQIMSQFCTCHDSSAVVAYANLCHEWAIRIEKRAKQIFTRFLLWAHKTICKMCPRLFPIHQADIAVMTWLASLIWSNSGSEALS